MADVVYCTGFDFILVEEIVLSETAEQNGARKFSSFHQPCVHHTHYFSLLISSCVEKMLQVADIVSKNVSVIGDAGTLVGQ